MAHPALPPRVARWLHLEQQVNERINNDAVFQSIAAESNGVLPAYRAEQGGAWRQELVWVDAARARAYGPVRRMLEQAFGLTVPRGKLPLLVHPQSRDLFAAPIARAGLHATDVVVRPTASCRSLVAQGRGREPWMLKVGIDTRIGTRWRGFEEHQVARAIVLSRLLGQVDEAVRERIGLDWFDELCGVATDVSGERSTSGWLLRRLPAPLRAGRSTLVPLFSLISREGGRPSLLTRMIRATRADPIAFAVEHVIHPMVDAYAHLALTEGLVGEMHGQNVLFEIGPDELPTGRVVLRDFTDLSLNVALRLARGRPLETPPPEFRPASAPIELAWITTDSFMLEYTGLTRRADVCVCGYGLRGSVWALHRGLRNGFPEVRLTALKSAYLRRWREATRAQLHFNPLVQPGLAGVPIDKCIEAFLARTPWQRLGAKPCTLPDPRRLRWIGSGPKRPTTRRALGLECGWGELFISDGEPVFWRPAF